MKNVRISVFVVFATLVVGVGCRRGEDGPLPVQLPAATQSGANTVGCRLSDGRTFIASGMYDRPFGFAFKQCYEGCYASSYSYATSFFASSCQEDYAIELNMYFQHDSLNNGSYTMGYRGVGFVRLEWTTRYEDGSQQQSIYVADSLLPSTVVVNRADDSVYAGTFEMILRNSFDSTQTLRLTDGRFDIHR